ncbi:hypothetical protein Tsubulata_011554, partial [Turnera subulata]
PSIKRRKSTRHYPKPGSRVSLVQGIAAHPPYISSFIWLGCLMSADLEHIDLNSDVVSVEQENDVGGVNVEPRDARTLTPSAVDISTVRESVVDKDCGFNGVTHSKEAIVRKNDSGGDGDGGGGGGGIQENVKGGASALGTPEVAQGNESKPGALASEYSVKAQNADGCSAMDVKLKVVDGNELPIPTETCPVSASAGAAASDGIGGNQEMEIDGQVTEGGEPALASDVEGFQERDGCCKSEEELNLVRDLKPSVSSDGDVGGDVNVREDSSKLELCVSDLVWGKVRSHPWWPGQIFDPSDASKKAKKYFKKGCYLIAYFGDQTFAWNDASTVKPFRPHFAQMVKQTILEDFHHAVDCALEELSRRVEFGLACPCMPDYKTIRTQVIVNAGVREESCRRVGGHSFSSAASFEPGKLIEFVKALGQFPFGGVDRLEVSTAQAQLLSFNRWKGYSCLPEFQLCHDLLESDKEIPQLVEVKPGNDSKVRDGSKKVKHQTDDKHLSSGKVKANNEGGSPHKRKHKSDDSGYSNKKEKSLADMLAERRLSVVSGKNESLNKSSCNLNSSSSMKRKATDSISNDSEVKDSQNALATGVGSNSSQPKKTYRVGDSILRVASQLNGLTPILKASNGSSLKSAMKNKNQEKTGKSQGKLLSATGDDASPDELVSQLCLVARDPIKRCNSLKSLVSFFVEFRNSFCPNHLSLQEVESPCQGDTAGGIIMEESNKTEIGTSDSGNVTDAHLSDVIIQSSKKGQSSHEAQNKAGELLDECATAKNTSPAEPQSAIQSDGNLDSEQRTSGEAPDLEKEEPADYLKENSGADPCSTALILKFSELDSLPSESNLNDIFRKFGPLKESETEVLKKTKLAKVVFCKREDAEAAFSSSGKYSVFGPSLISYRLKSVNASPSKSSPIAS